MHPPPPRESRPRCGVAHVAGSVATPRGHTWLIMPKAGPAATASATRPAACSVGGCAGTSLFRGGVCMMPRETRAGTHTRTHARLAHTHITSAYTHKYKTHNKHTQNTGKPRPPGPPHLVRAGRPAHDGAKEEDAAADSGDHGRGQRRALPLEQLRANAGAGVCACMHACMQCTCNCVYVGVWVVVCI